MIELQDGTIADLDNPTDDISVIAHSLSMQCRYNGHVRYFYSVAEHSVIVSLLMEEMFGGDPLEGLLHDAHEAIVSDMCRPHKGVIAGWREFEERVEVPLRRKFGFSDSITPECKRADTMAGYIEARLLLPSQGDHWPKEHGWFEAAARAVAEGWRVLNLYPPEAKAAFIRRYNDLVARRS